MALVLGCWKLTDSLLPTLKPCQSMTARALFCVMFTALALVAICADPALTLLPLGSAFACVSECHCRKRYAYQQSPVRDWGLPIGRV